MLTHLGRTIKGLIEVSSGVRTAVRGASSDRKEGVRWWEAR